MPQHLHVSKIVVQLLSETQIDYNLLYLFAILLCISYWTRKKKAGIFITLLPSNLSIIDVSTTLTFPFAAFFVIYQLNFYIYNGVCTTSRQYSTIDNELFASSNFCSIVHQYDRIKTIRIRHCNL